MADLEMAKVKLLEEIVFYNRLIEVADFITLGAIFTYDSIELRLILYGQFTAKHKV